MLAAGLASLERNDGVPMETALADFGLTMEDFERMGRTPAAAETLTRPGNLTRHEETDYLVR